LNDKYKIKSYLISLTTDFIADLVKDYFGFVDVYSVKCVTKKVGSRQIFTGEVLTNLGSANEMKNTLFGNFEQTLAGNPFLCSFDSIDDIPIAKMAALKVAVNQSEELKNLLKADISLYGKDPWEEFYNML